MAMQAKFYGGPKDGAIEEISSVHPQLKFKFPQVLTIKSAPEKILNPSEVIELKVHVYEEFCYADAEELETEVPKAYYKYKGIEEG